MPNPNIEFDPTIAKQRCHLPKKTVTTKKKKHPVGTPEWEQVVSGEEVYMGRTFLVRINSKCFDLV